MSRVVRRIADIENHMRVMAKSIAGIKGDIAILNKHVRRVERRLNATQLHHFQGLANRAK